MKKDIRVDTAFPSHRKTRRLTKMLGEKAPFSLISLWCYMGEYKRTGRLLGMSNQDIADAANWEDDPDKFIEALLMTHYLDKKDDGSLEIHEWNIHQPYVSNEDQRREMAKIKAKIGWLKRRGEWNDEQHAYLLEELSSFSQSKQSRSNAVAMQEQSRSNAVAMQEQSRSNAVAMQEQSRSNAVAMQEQSRSNAVAMQKACIVHRVTLASGFLGCSRQCPFFVSYTPYPYPFPSPYPFPIFMPENFSGVPVSSEFSGKKAGKNKRTAPVIDYEQEIPALLNSFNGIRPLIENYLSVITKQNKSGLMAQSRQYNYLLEFSEIQKTTDKNDLFKLALSKTTEKGADNLNYMRQIIKTKQTETTAGITHQPRKTWRDVIDDN